MQRNDLRGDSASLPAIALDAIDDGIAVLDPDLTVLFVNRAMQALHARSGPLVGRKCYEAFQGRTEPCEVCPTMRTMATGERQTKVLPADQADESSGNWLELASYPCRDAQTGAIAGVVERVRDVTAARVVDNQLRDALEAAEEQRGRVEAILESIGDAISVQDTSFKVLFQNRFHKELMGAHEGEYCYAAYQGRADVCPGCHLALAFVDGQLHTQERTTTRDGVTRYVEITASAIKDASGGVVAGIEAVRNITPRKVAEEQLRITHHAVESALGAIAIADLEGRLTYVNPAFLRLWGYANADEVLGRSAASVWEDETRAAEIRATLLGKGSWSGELTGRRRDGSLFDVELHTNVVRDEAGKPLSLFASFMDITEHKRLEQEQLRAEKLESLGVLAGGIAHDFNNLLTGILGNVDLLRLGTAKDTAAFRLLEATEKATLRARNLTQQLLTFARGGSPVKKELHLGEVVQESSAFALRGSPVTAAFDIAADLLHVEADEDQIHQVVHNIVLNAAQAMAGGGSLKLGARNLSLGADEVPPLHAGRYVELSFLDSGPGIPAENLSRIFDPYFTTKDGGSGLGLATAYSIVRRHGGHVAIESAPGAGTTVRVYLPAVERRHAPRLEEAAHPGGGVGRVLVMDDEQLVLDVAVDMLNVLGYEAATARNGEEAIALCRSAMAEGRPFRAVIVDLTIPGGMGGREVVGALRTECPGTPVLVSSGYSSDPIMADYRSYGFAAVIKKPYRVVDLDGALNEALSRAGGATGSA